jgi:hypothetical protein
MGWLKSDAGKATVAGVLLVLAAGVMWWFWPRSHALPTRLRFVCTATGERFEVPRENVSMYPATNPKTGQATLVPVAEENGQIVVPPRYRALLRQLGEQNKWADPETGAVRPPA